MNCKLGCRNLLLFTLVLCKNTVTVFSPSVPSVVDEANILAHVQFLIVELMQHHLDLNGVEATIHLTEAYDELCRVDLLF